VLGVRIHPTDRTDPLSSCQGHALHIVSASTGVESLKLLFCAATATPAKMTVIMKIPTPAVRDFHLRMTL